MRLSGKILPLATLMLCLSCWLSAEGLGERATAELSARGVSPWLIVLLISMVPVIELRGAIPVAIAVLGMPWQQAVLISVLGNMLPVPIILLFIEWILGLIAKTRWGSKFTSWLFTRTRNRGKVVERYEELGLAVFVGIPLPGTGAWTGALAARIFGLPFWKSLLWIFIGVLLAAAVVTLLTLLGTTLVG